jgi:hypothetical protein
MFLPILTDSAHKSNFSQQQPASFLEKKASAEQALFENYSSWLATTRKDSTTKLP